MRFLDYLAEETEQDSEKFTGNTHYEEILNINLLRIKMLPMVGQIVDNLHDDHFNIPMIDEIEMVDILQSVKQIIVESLEHYVGRCLNREQSDELIDKLRKDIKVNLRILYPNTALDQIMRVLETQVIMPYQRAGIRRTLRSVNLNDLGMGAKDDFGRLLYYVYNRIIKKSEELDPQDFNEIRRWVERLKRGGDTLKAQSRTRRQIKMKMLDRLAKSNTEEDINDTTEEDIDATKVDTEERDGLSDFINNSDNERSNASLFK